MLDVSYGNFKLDIPDIDRANLIFISLPLDGGIVTLRLYFNNLNEIEFYYEQLFQLAKTIQININLDVLSAYDEALKKIDKFNNYKSLYKVSKSIFGKIGDNMISTGYSLGVQKISLDDYDNIIIPKFITVSKKLLEINR